MTFTTTAEEIRETSRVETDPLEELLAESDRLLNWLELRNTEDHVRLPDSGRMWIRTLTLAVVGVRLNNAAKSTRYTQSAIDHVFDAIQPPLLRKLCRQRGLMSALYGPEEEVGDTHSEHCGGTSCGS